MTLKPVPRTCMVSRQVPVMVQWLRNGFLAGLSVHQPARHLPGPERLSAGASLRDGQQETEW